MTLIEKTLFILPVVIPYLILAVTAWVKLLPIIDEMTGANDEIDHD